MANEEALQASLKRMEDDIRLLVAGQGVMEKKLTRLQAKQESFTEKLELFAKDNDRAHNEMYTLTHDKFVDVNKRIDELEESDDEQNKYIHIGQGKQSVFGNIWQLVLALVGGGFLVTIGGIIAKAIGIFG